MLRVLSSKYHSIKLKMLKASVVLLSAVFIGTAVATCPPDILTRPCICTQNDGNFLRCENITDKNVLDGVFRRTGNVPFSHLELRNVSIESIPTNSFITKQVKDINIVDSNLTTLFYGPPTPQESLRSINLMNVNFQNPFPWNYFKPLRNLIAFLAIGVEIPALDHSFKDNVNKGLKYFALSNTSTVRIADGVLSEFKNLEYFKIEKNPLNTYKRNYFSRPSNIVMLYLDGNQIETLPADAFVEMPRLQNINLSSNKLSSIPIGAFSQIKHQLSNLELEDNPVNCDCGFNWLISNKPKYSLTGKCSGPEKLKDKSVKDLKSQDIGSCH